MRWPDEGVGANGLSLVVAQRNFQRFGAMTLGFLVNVRAATLSEPIEIGWRVINPSRDSFEPVGVQEAPWPDDLTTLYYWRPTFWRLP